MPSLIFAVRPSGVLVAAALAGILTACAAEPVLTFTAPTMAPQQSLVDACSILGEQTEQLSQETEQQVRQGIADATAKLARGEMPSVAVIADPLSGALSEVERQVTNSEALEAVGSVRDALQGFQGIAVPDSALEAPKYLADLSAQANKLTQASEQLRALCDTE